MRNSFLAVLVMMVLASRAHADPTDGMQDYEIAIEAGEIIGGARACDYELDMAAVEQFIKTRISNMEAGDRTFFRNSVDTRDMRIREMPDNERQAQCILQRELAGRYGFIKAND